MTIVYRSTNDVFDYLSLSDIMVNPVNLTGAMGAGLALEFKTRYPKMFEEYKALCDAKQFHIGGLHVYDVQESPAITIINLPTKRHWSDGSRVDDICKGLAALRDYLIDKPFASVTMPMLGCGLGKLAYEEMLPHFKEYLDDLPNIVHLCMRPEFFEKPLRYLGIVGDRDFIYRDRVIKHVQHALKEWNLTFDDFEAIVSGGASRGVDFLACGTSKQDASYQTSIAKEFHPRPPVIIPANWNKYGNAAGMIRNKTVVDIVTHCVAIVGPRSKGTRNTISLIESYNEIHFSNPKLLHIVTYPSLPEQSDTVL